MHIYKYIYNAACIFVACSIITAGCKKEDAFLNKKPDGKLTTIGSLSDIQKLLTNEQIFNLNATPGLGATSSEPFIVSDDDYQSRDYQDQQLYIWAKDIYPKGANVPDWSQPYQQVLYANLALDALDKLKPEDNQLFNTLKGQALFYRAYAYFDLMQQFTVPYDSTNAETELGIPLRLTSNLNDPVIRSSQKKCYDQIISDLKAASLFLKDESSRVTAPGKTAVNAMLARVYLCLGEYSNAFNFANQALQSNIQLFDFNRVHLGGLPAFADGLTQYPVPEVIYFTSMTGGLFTNFTRARIPDSFYNLFDNNDLRKEIYFTTIFGFTSFIGTYDFRGLTFFDGLAIDEILLIRAECYARKGDKEDALKDLNRLLINRYKTGTFSPLTASDANAALKLIIEERKKELCFRGLRWLDLRRLNKDPEFAETLVRTVDGSTYTLEPGSNRYALPIPDNEIQLSGIQQNDR